MHFMVLGPLEVRTQAGENAAVRRGRPRALLHLLLMHRRVVVPVEVVADRLWEGDLPQDAANAVHQLVSYLRRALGPEGKQRLVTSPVGYLLDAADDDVDAGQFDQLLQQASSDVALGSMAAAQRALTSAEEAARLWRGDPYPESSGYEWASGDISRLKESWVQLQETRLEAMLTMGRHREVVLEAQSLAAAHPLREQFHAHRALALYRSERQSEALEALRGVRELLADELGLDPSMQLQLLEQQILRQDAQLTWRPDDSLSSVAASAPVPPSRGQSDAAGEGPPPPTALPRAPHLHGRESDREAVAELLVPGALVTVTGAAGIGKSALARTLAHSELFDRVWYVDLSDVDSHHLAPTAVARKTGFSGHLPSDPTSMIADAFADASGLLVLDTCEHLLPSVASTAQTILGRAPQLTIVATSRRPLDVPDEVVYRLRPLPVPADHRSPRVEDLAAVPSVTLFVERAVRVRNDFRLDETTAADVAEIVRALEGLPLGIELAASNADALDTRGMRDRLNQLLTAAPDSGPDSGPGPDPGSGPDSGPDRAHPPSLSAALDSSCILLTDEEKQVLGPLTVFHGRFDLDAVKAVVDPDLGDPFPVLASLVRQSMVSFEGAETYRLLRPIRSYAGAKAAASPDHDRVRDRHSAHVAATTTEASRELRTSATALTRLERLLPDARASMEWSLATGKLDLASDIAVAYTWYWAINGLAEEGIGWLTAVAGEVERRRESSPVTPVREAAVLRSIGLLSNPRGAVRQAADYCRRALELSRAAEDWAGATAALLTLGIAEWAIGDFTAAAAAHDEALDLVSRTGDTWHRVSALALRARTALDAGEADTAERIEAAIEAGQAANEHQMLSVAMTLQARHHLGIGQADAAAVAAELAIEQAESIGYREGELSALNLLGRSLLAQGDHDRAHGCFARALHTATAIGHPGAVCEAVESTALWAVDVGRHEQAYLLLLATSRERDRVGMQVPAYDAATVARAKESSAEALGGSASVVEARAKLLRFDALVGDLMAEVTPSPA